MNFVLRYVSAEKASTSLNVNHKKSDEPRVAAHHL